MDTDTLVENQIEEGRRYLAQLRRNSFDVTAAFWVKTSEEGRWYLYIASNLFDEKRAANAYRAAYGILHAMEPAWFSMSEIKLVSPNNPIVRDAIAARDRRTGRIPAQYHGMTLGNLSIEEAYIYPQVGDSMTPKELLQTLTAKVNRPAESVLQPSLITLRDGNSIQAIVTGFNFQTSGGITLFLIDPATNVNRQIQGTDVASIQ